MSEQVRLPQPLGLCAQCLRPPVAIAHDEHLLAIHCAHRGAGALMPILAGGIAGGRWTILVPISAVEFADYVAKLMHNARELSLAVNAADRRLN